eukprot:6173509-Pleurochrysis_carterae.AAC.1
MPRLMQLVEDSRPQQNNESLALNTHYADIVGMHASSAVHRLIACSTSASKRMCAFTQSRMNFATFWSCGNC